MNMQFHLNQKLFMKSNFHISINNDIVELVILKFMLLLFVLPYCNIIINALF